MHQFWAIVRRPFVLDLRALALLRMGTAAVLLLDLAIRSTDLEAHYANSGILPIAALIEHAWTPYHVSLHISSGLWQVEAILFCFAALAAAALLIGYHTRLATFISWVLLVSVQNRNPFISQAGDDLLRMLVFWGLFLPWGRVWAHDASRQPTPASHEYFSAATIAYCVQLALLYWCTAFLKSGSEWTHDGTALYYALSLDQILLPGGRLLYPHPDLLRFLTFATWYIELLLPFALFVPFKVTWWRFLVIGILTVFHLGISLTLFVGLFFIINFVSLLGLLPPVALDWVAPKVAQQFGRVAQWQSDRFSIQLPWQARTKVTNSNKLSQAVKEIIVLLSLGYVCCWNIDDLEDKSGRWMPVSARWVGYLLRIDQHWGMFAPTVFKDDGWFILEGSTNKGQLLDLNRQGNPVSPAKPKAIVQLFRNDRWRKYSENYLFTDNSWMRPYYCNYLLRIWHQNSAHPPLTHLTIVYMKEVSLPNYRVPSVTRQVLCDCLP